MDPVQDQLVKDVADLKRRVVELGAHQITEERVREIGKEELADATPKARPFRLSSRINKN